MKIKFKKLTEDAFTPKKAHESDAGFDIVAIKRDMNPATRTLTYDTGLAIEIPENFVGLMFPRSSIYQKDLRLCNSVGVIDSGYTGEIKLKFKYDDILGKWYNIGDKIGQIVIMPLPEISLVEVDELQESDRGSEGWGSSGA